MTRANDFSPANLGAFSNVVPFRGPFFVTNTTTAAVPYSLRDILDGTSNTMCVSEIKIVADSGTKSDSRGDIWSVTKCGHMFTAATTPNSKVADQLDGTSGCVNTASNPPCFAASGALREFNAARSIHPGGVNVAFRDGSVKFIEDSVSVPTWRALSTKDGMEVVSADQY